MNRQRSFVLAGVLLLGVVGYLATTGMKESMLYYYTPDEFAAQVADDPSARELGVKLGGRVAPGTVAFDQTTLDLTFRIADVESGEVRWPVHFVGPLPDTFEEGRDVVVEGRLTEAGVFEATNVLTKCGSRYEAVEEDFRT